MLSVVGVLVLLKRKPVTSSLTKDMNSSEDLYRANSIRVLSRIIDATMLGAIERYVLSDNLLPDNYDNYVVPVYWEVLTSIMGGTGMYVLLSGLGTSVLGDTYQYTGRHLYVF